MSSGRAALRFDRRGWLVFAVPPVAWMAQLLLVYLLVPVACQRGTRAPLLVVTAVALVVTGVALVAAGRRPRRRSGGADDRGSMAGVGRIQGGVFVFAILGAGVAAIWIDPCA